MWIVLEIVPPHREWSRNSTPGLRTAILQMHCMQPHASQRNLWVRVSNELSHLQSKFQTGQTYTVKWIVLEILPLHGEWPRKSTPGLQTATLQMHCMQPPASQRNFRERVSNELSSGVFRGNCSCFAELRVYQAGPCFCLYLEEFPFRLLCF